MRCFVVSSDTISGRLDPQYLIALAERRRVSSKYPPVPLADMLAGKPQYGANEPAVDGNPKTDTRYIRITDIDEFGNLISDKWKTARSTDEKYLLKADDLLFARSGATAGKTFIYRKEHPKAIFAGYLIRFRIDQTKADPRFVFYYTQLPNYTLWVKSTQRPSGQPNINSEEFKALRIPLPPLPIQQQIVKSMETAYARKQQQEEEANKIFDSIDAFVLQQLGLALPEVKESKCYSVLSEEVEGRRLDTYHYQPKFELVVEALEKTKFKVFSLGALIADLSGGATPEVEGNFYTDSSGVPFLRVQNITKQGLELTDVKFIKREVHEVMLKRSQLQKDDLVFTITGRIGSVAVVPNGFEGNINQHSVRFHLKEEVEGLRINPHYIATFLNTSFGNILSFRETTGGTRPALDYRALQSLRVPLPPSEIQSRISDETKRRIIESARLKGTAVQVLDETKQQVEALLLGR